MIKIAIAIGCAFNLLNFVVGFFQAAIGLTYLAGLSRLGRQRLKVLRVISICQPNLSERLRQVFICLTSFL